MRKTAKNNVSRARGNVAGVNGTQHNELMSQAGYARHRGLDRSTINRHVKSGKIPISEDGLIDPVSADEALGPPRSASDSAAFLRARTERIRYQGLKAKLDYEKSTGVLIDAEALQFEMEDLAVDLVRDIEALQNHTQDFVAAAHAGGRDAVHKKLGELAGEIKATLAANLNTVAVKFGLNKMKELKT